MCDKHSQKSLKMLCTIDYSDTYTITTYYLKKNLDLGKIQQPNSNFELFNEILYDLKDKLIVGGIFCDLAKVCDCVN